VIDKLEALEARFEDLNTKLSDPDVVSDQKAYKEIMQEYSHLQTIMEEYSSYKKINEDLEGAKDMLADEADAELKSMAKEEIKDLEEAKTASEEKLKVLLIPKDPLDGKNTIVEIRAGTGGEEAALFAADLFRMYSRFAEHHGWKSEIMEASESENGGFKEVIFSLSGKEVFGTMRWGKWYTQGTKDPRHRIWRTDSHLSGNGSSSAGGRRNRR
jgi:peptide chain release factor 1